MPSQKSPTAVQVGPGSIPTASTPGAGSASRPPFLLEGDYGDVLVEDGGSEITIQTGAVTNPMLAAMPANTVKANYFGTDGSPGNLSVASNTVVGRAGGNIDDLAVGANTVLGRAGGDVESIALGANTVLGRAGGNVQNLALGANTVLGRAGGNIETIAIGANTVLGRAAGDVTAGQVVTDQIADNIVTNAKLAQMVSRTVKGRGRRDGDGEPLDLSANSLADILWSSRLTAPGWFDDMVLTHPVTDSTNPWMTGDGSWSLIVLQGTLTSLTSVATANRPGVTRFTMSSGGNVQARLVKHYGVSGAQFAFPSFKRLVCGVRRNGSSGGFTLGLADSLAYSSEDAVTLDSTTANFRAITFNNGSATLVTTGVSTNSGSFYDMSIERLINGDLEFRVDDVVVATIPQATHGLGGSHGLYAFLNMSSTVDTTTFDVDYVGAQFEVNRS